MAQTPWKKLGMSRTTYYRTHGPIGDKPASRKKTGPRRYRTTITPGTLASQISATLDKAFPTPPQSIEDREQRAAIEAAVDAALVANFLSVISCTRITDNMAIGTTRTVEAIARALKQAGY